MKSNKTNKRTDKRDSDWEVRTMTFNVVVDGGVEKYRQVLQSITAYRQFLQQFMGLIYLAESAAMAPSYNKKRDEVSLSDGKSLSDTIHKAISATLKESTDSKTGKFEPEATGKSVSNAIRAAIEEILTEASNDLTRKSASDVLRLFGGITNGKKYYELRPLFFDLQKRLKLAAQSQTAFVPEFESHVWDEFCKDLNAIYTQKDPRLGIPRNLLAQRGERGVPSPNRIGIPIMHYPGTRDGYARVEERGDEKRFFLKWDKGLGEIGFIVQGPLEINGKKSYLLPNEGNQYVFHKIAKGDWTFQTPHIREQSGSLRITISYKRPSVQQKEKLKLSENRHLQITFNPGDAARFLEMSIQKTLDSTKIDSVQKDAIPVHAFLSNLRALTKQQYKRELERDSCPKFEPTLLARRQSVQAKLSALTLCREEKVKHEVHCWANQIIKKCVHLNCGHIDVYDVPKKFFEYDVFAWAKFKFSLEYHAKDRGIVVEWHDTSAATQSISENLAAGE